jgi:DnaK suppressor protein
MPAKKKPARPAGKPAMKTARKKVSKAPSKKAVAEKTAKKTVAPKKPKKTVAKKPAAGKAVAPQKALAKKPMAAGKKVAPKEAAPLREEVLRRLLIQKREDFVREAQTEIAKYIKGENRQLVETALDDGDWSVVDLSEDINLRKLSTHKQTLAKIDEALRKLRAGTYGKCEDCGDEIDAGRLRVLPFAIYCRDCQEKREEIEAIEREMPPSGR